jgi:mRNA-degrading endonuclease toxin of MazEF toxin-antitoxin module
MVDKLFAVQREKIRTILGQLSEADMAAVDRALGYMLGLALR